jgi:hypothetical protein
MEIFKVPKRQVRARVALEGGVSLTGVLFAAAAGPDGAPGRVADHLNNETERFVALATEQQRYLVRKSQIVDVQIAGAEMEDELPESEVAERQVEVRVTLLGGARLEGRVLYSMPEGRRRLLDYLNAAPPFVPMLGDDRLTLINRDRILTLVSHDDEPAPDPRQS